MTTWHDELREHKRDCLNALHEIFLKRPSRKETMLTVAAVLSVVGATVGYALTETKLNTAQEQRLMTVERKVYDNAVAIEAILPEIPKISKGIDSLLSRRENDH
jgi:hypothetical protein